MHNIHNCKIRASGDVRAKMATKRCWLNASGRPASSIQIANTKGSEMLQPRYAPLFSWMDLHIRFTKLEFPLLVVKSYFGEKT